jgi:hypothetical protein
MSYRRSLLPLAALLAAGALSADRLSAAPVPIPAPSGPEFQGLPDLDSSSSRFLILEGESKFSLPGVPGAAGRTLLQLTFDASGPGSRVKVALFDGDATGLWDQRPRPSPIPALQLLPEAPDIAYRLYADPDGTAAEVLNGGVGPAPVLLEEVRASQAPFNNPANDASWIMAFDRLPDGGALGSEDGLHHYVLEAELLPAASSDGFEACGFKVAVNGRYALPAGSLIGFMGGVIDSFTMVEQGLVFTETADPLPDGEVYFYDGTWAFPFDGCALATGDVELFEADADWNATIPEGVVDENPTGLPPDDGGLYRFPDGSLRDNLLFTIPPAIAWDLLDPDAFPVFDSSTSAPAGHPSITSEQQGGAEAPFQLSVLPGAAVRARPGTWTFRWTGVDMNNAVFLKFNAPFGTIPLNPPLDGRVFCDDGDGRYEVGEVGLSGLTVTLTPVDAAGNAVGASIDVTTDADGLWSREVSIGRWKVEVSGTGFTPGFAQPRFVEIPDCFGATIDSPYECAGALRGVVWREKDLRPCDGVRQADEAGIAGVLVRLTPLVPAGPAVFDTTDAAGRYEFLDLPAGDYRVEVDGAQPILVNLEPSTALTVDTVVFTGETTEVDFGFCPPARIRGVVYRNNPERDCDGERQGDDLPIPGVEVTLTPVSPAGPTVSDITDAAGAYSFDLLPEGTYLVEVDGSQAVLVGLLPGSATSVQADLLPGQTEEIDFGFCALARIRGVVFREGGRTGCDGVFVPGADQPVPGVTVTLTFPDGAVRAVPTDANGRYLFDDLPAGTYLVEVDGAAPALVNTTPSTLTEVPVVLLAGDDQEVDFGFCPLGRIRGVVFREGGRTGCDGLFVPGADQPVPGVRVTLTLPDGSVRSVLTDANGRYLFDELEAGPYVVEVDGAAPALVNTTPSTLTEVPVVLLAGDDQEVDFGFCPLAAIRGIVYLNDPTRVCDGDRDGTDRPIGGVRVTLTPVSPAGAERTDLTDAAGAYAFEGLDAGTYIVEVEGGQPVLVGLIPGSETVVQAVVLPGETEEIDFGFCALGRIHGIVFREPGEPDCDGVYTRGEDTPVPGVEVTLTLPDGSQRTDLSDAGGRYAFEDLPPGDYLVEVDGAAPVLVGTTPSTDTAVGVVLLGGGEERVDFGFCPKVQSLCGHVFLEPLEDCDGVRGPDDEGIEGITVLLVVGGRTVVANTTTDADGRYCFLGIEARDDYTVTVIGLNDPPLVDLEPSTPTALDVVVPPGASIDDVDFGFCPCDCPEPCVLLVIDEDSIDNGLPPNFFSDVDVNDQIAEIGVRRPLRWFQENIGAEVDLWTGQVGDEGWFAVKEIPSSWDRAGPTTDGAMNFLRAGPGLGSYDRNGQRESLLDKIPLVTPLRATGLGMLVGRKVCAVVYDSDVSINYSPLNGSLKGANLGIVAFEVVAVRPLRGESSSSLPVVTVRVLDASEAFSEPVGLFTEAPEPRTSSIPMDID